MSQPSDPAPTQSIHEVILAARRQAVLFRQILPPNHDPAHLSFFGGLPIAPSGFPWPRGESEPDSFVMQVDCSAVPTDGRLGMFPDFGVLYVFLGSGVDYESGYQNKFRVIWKRGPSSGWNEISPPNDLPPILDSKLAWKWPQSDADWPRLLPKWPFDPVVIHGGPLPDDQEALEETYAWLGTIYPHGVMPSIDGAVVQHLRFGYKDGKPTKDRPFAGFPQDWNAVRITTGLITNRTEWEISVARNPPFPRIER